MKLSCLKQFLKFYYKLRENKKMTAAEWKDFLVKFLFSIYIFTCVTFVLFLIYYMHKINLLCFVCEADSNPYTDEPF